MNRLNKVYHHLVLVTLILPALVTSCSGTGELYVVSQTEGPIQANCYLMYELPSRQAAIFDVAGTLDSLSEVIKVKKLNLKYIFITHAHWDHVEGIFELKEQFPGASICISNEEYKAMQVYTEYAKESDPGKFAELTRDSAILKMVSIDLGSLKPDIYIEDMEEFKLGNKVITAIITPGHSIGSVCFSCDNLLFTGDVLSYRSVGNTTFYLASRPELINSVRRLYRLFPDSTVVYPGHGRMTDIGSEKVMNEYVSLEGGKWDKK